MMNTKWEVGTKWMLTYNPLVDNHKPKLLVSRCDEYGNIKHHFAQIEMLEHFEIKCGDFVSSALCKYINENGIKIRKETKQGDESLLAK